MLAKSPTCDVFAATDALRAIEVLDERRQPTTYDLTPGSASDWYLVHVFPGEDTRALRWLSRRGFGVFMPMMQRTRRDSGILVQGREPMFPGWLFVYCRDIVKNGPRIRRCQGVSGILSDPATGRPIAIDQAAILDGPHGPYCQWPKVGFVDRLQAWSAEYNPNVPHGHWGVRSTRQVKRSVRKLGPKERRNLDRMTIEAKKREIWDQDQWEQVMRLDPGARIAVLMKTIKGASDAGGSAARPEA